MGRKAKEMRRVNQKVEDQEAKTKRAKAATKKAINLKTKFDLLSKKENRMKLHFMRLAKIARGHVKVARNEHKRQVKMKKDMLAKYARITAKNLRKAKSTVRREVRATLKAHRAKRSWMRKESRSLVRLAKEKARMLTIRKTHTVRRSKNRKVAERVVRKHDRIRAKAAFRSRMFIRHTVAANRRTKSANSSRMTIIAAAKKAARLSAKLICNIRLSTSMKRHMFDSEMCERSKNFLNKLTDEKANAKFSPPRSKLSSSGALLETPVVSRSPLTRSASPLVNTRTSPCTTRTWPTLPPSPPGDLPLRRRSLRTERDTSLTRNGTPRS